MTRDEIIAERAQLNFQEALEHGHHLRVSTRTWVIAKDTEAGMVYLGGLGGSGVGEMWSEARNHVDDATYADAPEHKYLGDPFRFE